MSTRNRCICVVRAPASAWTPPQGVGVAPLVGLDWHLVHVPWPGKAQLVATILEAGLPCQEWGIPYDRAERLLRYDASQIVRRWHRGEVSGADATAAAERLDTYLTWLEQQT